LTQKCLAVKDATQYNAALFGEMRKSIKRESSEYSFPSSKIRRKNLVFTSEKSSVFHAFHSTGVVALKILNNANPLTKDAEELENEFKITKNISHPGIRKCLKRAVFDKKQALVLEWVDGKTIKQYGKCNVKNFLWIAREIASALAALHSEYIMHNHLTADNIMVNESDKSIKIIDFGKSAKFYTKSFEKSCERKGDYFHCISPKNTELLNHTKDFCSDSYSLGAVFYFMLAGKFPFESGNESVFLQMHGFENAPLLTSIDPTIPSPISEMVAKLMTKNVDDRYLSTRGILFDLDLMLSEYETDPHLHSVALAQYDFS